MIRKLVSLYIRMCIMRTNVVLDDELVNEAFMYSQAVHTKRELIEAALTEYVSNRKRKNIRDLVGKIKFHDGYDYKSMRAGR